MCKLKKNPEKKKMGIFDFLKPRNKSKIERAIEVENEISSLTKLKNEDRFPNLETHKQEVVLTKSEIESFINQEVISRITNEESIGFSSKNFDPLFKEAAEIIVIAQQGSASLLQRKLKLGYNRAGRLIDDLELIGIIGPFDGENARLVNIADLAQLDNLFEKDEERNERLRHFKTYILPHQEILISSKVEEIKKQEKIEEERKLKENLRREIIEKENERIEKERIKKLSVEITDELIEQGLLSNSNNILKREKIPQEVLDNVWNRDGGKCVYCGSQEKIEFDHIIPFSKGGSNTYRNIQILCEKCNREKSASIG